MQLDFTQISIEVCGMKNPEEECIVCERSSKDVALIQLYYQNATFWICPQHLPVLIHKPEQLADRLPGAAGFGKPDTPPHG
jgi:hypothetical protein